MLSGFLKHIQSHFDTRHMLSSSYCLQPTTSQWMLLHWLCPGFGKNEMKHYTPHNGIKLPLSEIYWEITSFKFVWNECFCRICNFLLLLVKHSNGPIEIILFGPWYYIANQSIDECIIFSRSKLNQLLYWPQLVCFTYFKSTRFNSIHLKFRNLIKNAKQAKFYLICLLANFGVARDL